MLEEDDLMFVSAAGVPDEYFWKESKEQKKE